MPRCNAQDVLIVTRLTLEEISLDSVNQQIGFAADTVDFLSPLDDTDARSLRAEPLRKRAEIYFAAAGTIRTYAPAQWLLFPAKEILSTEGISTGADFPTANEAYAAFLRIAEDFEAQAMNTLKLIKPVTSQIST